VYVEDTKPMSAAKKWLIAVVAFLVVVGAVLGGVLGTQLNKNKGGDSEVEVSNGSVPSKYATGTNGSTVTTDNGETFTYINDFGGYWTIDTKHPFNVSGQAQEDTPTLLEEWDWSRHRIRGVNLGGWLVTEPFIVPALYEQYQTSTPQAVDEYTLSQAMGANKTALMTEHYDTFITEKDFADIAAAGLNWVRIPIGYWAIETEDGEPYVEGVSWTYFLKAIDWCRKYGLRILLDLHALPGSQNGWNHSGKSGSLNWMYGGMGFANAQRSLEHIRMLVQYISMPGIKEVVPILGLVNEVPGIDTMTPNIGQGPLGSFYHAAYNMTRESIGYGRDNGPIVLFHDGFLNIKDWAGFLAGADRLALDQHLYLAFGEGNQYVNFTNRESIACGWGGGTNDTSTNFGITIGGEWSIALGDCGKWLNGVGSNSTYATMHGSCDEVDRWMNFNETFKAGLMSYTLSQMDALQNWFFWTWRIGNSTELGYSSAPMWHYQLGLEQGWIPKDPRVAYGHCQSKGYCEGCLQFQFEYPESATGVPATTAPTIAPTQLDAYPWPPVFLQPTFTDPRQVGALPTLTQTGAIKVLPTPLPSVPGLGNGWANAADTRGAYVKVATNCAYVGQYDGNGMAIATNICGSTATPTAR
jgi:aryl-phospho-beta-D-glucosidase BglC (GH1 family)